MTDHLTSFVDAIPIGSKCDQATSNAFSILILRHGVCGQVILDNGREFQGPIFQDLIKRFHEWANNRKYTYIPPPNAV